MKWAFGKNWMPFFIPSRDSLYGYQVEIILLRLYNNIVIITICHGILNIINPGMENIR
jgi:hypothetical protein